MAACMNASLVQQKGCGLEDLDIDDLTAIDSRIVADVFAVLGVENSVRSRNSYGGTAPDNVRTQVAAAKERYLS